MAQRTATGNVGADSDETPDFDARWAEWNRACTQEERALIETAPPETLLGMLSTRNPWSPDLSEALDLLRAADRLASWVAARKAALTAQVFHQVRRQVIGGSGEDPASLSFTQAAQELAPLLKVPGRTAHRSLREALRLTDDLPSTWEALHDGTITTAQAQAIVDESSFVPVDAMPEFEETILETAFELTPPKLARRCRRLREELHPDSIIERANRARKDRDVTIQADQDGMAWLSAYLPAEQAVGIFNRVDTAARNLLKTDGIWTANLNEGGTHQATSLAGRTYTTLPELPPPF